MQIQDPFLDEMDAAEYLSISVHTLRTFRRHDRNCGPRYTKFGASVRYRRSWLDAYAEQHSVVSAA